MIKTNGDLRVNKVYMNGGFVFRTGKTGWNSEFNNVIEYSLKLDSNPAFTSSVIVSYARAVCRMNKEGMTGCKNSEDVCPNSVSDFDMCHQLT